MATTLVTLPVDIRFLIYDYFIPSAPVICFDLDYRNERGLKCLKIIPHSSTAEYYAQFEAILKLSTAHSVFAELLTVLLQKTHFQFLAIDQALLWLQRIGSHNSSAIQHLSTDYHISKWQLNTRRICNNRLTSILEHIPNIRRLTLYFPDFRFKWKSDVERTKAVVWRAQIVFSKCPKLHRLFRKEIAERELPHVKHYKPWLCGDYWLNGDFRLSNGRRTQRQRYMYVCDEIKIDPEGLGTLTNAVEARLEFEDARKNQKARKKPAKLHGARRRTLAAAAAKQ